ncbi:MAG: hypothetical protein K1X53_16305 [Candidatus Sumerlaeaceae bacterium]|nr:hypothetical protein [Candidatus Sumerlaeaceae bacterium]
MSHLQFQSSQSRLFLENLRKQRLDLACVVAVVGAIALRSSIPALIWISPFAIALVYFAFRVAPLPRTEKSWIAGCCGVALLINTIVVTAFGYHNPEVHYVMLDDYQYLLEGRAISKAWSEGFYPALSLKGTLPYLGTLHTGYQRALACAFYLFGGKPLAAIAFNVFCISLIPAVGYLMGLTLAVSGRGKSNDAEGTDYTIPRAAALLASLNLCYAYWGTWILKDCFLSLVFAVALVQSMDFLFSRRILPGLGCILMIPIVATVRVYSAAFLVVGGAAYVLSLVPRRYVSIGVATAAIALALVTYSDRGGTYVAQLMHSLTTLLPAEAKTTTGSIKYFAAGVPRLLLAPYAWVKAIGPNPLYGLYPGMWFLYLVVYPLGFAGLHLAARRNNLLVIVPFVTLALAWMLRLLTFAGDSPRQRLYTEVILTTFAAIGIVNPQRKRWVAAWYGFLILFAAAQLISLYRHN